MKVAPGIWQGTAGDTSRELRYTKFAAAPPRLDALRARPDRDFPFGAQAVSFERTADGKVMIRVPCGADERLFGFGLQLHGLDRDQGVLTLYVDHWSTGGGRTHAPVPFYVSSRGYGVFIDTARFLKVYARIGNRKDSPRNPPPIDRNPPPGEPAPRWDALPASDAVEILVEGPGADIVVIAGENLADVVSRYNLLGVPSGDQEGSAPSPVSFLGDSPVGPMMKMPQLPIHTGGRTCPWRVSRTARSTTGRRRAAFCRPAADHDKTVFDTGSRWEYKNAVKNMFGLRTNV